MQFARGARWPQVLSKKVFQIRTRGNPMRNLSPTDSLLCKASSLAKRLSAKRFNHMFFVEGDESATGLSLVSLLTVDQLIPQQD